MSANLYNLANWELVIFVGSTACLDSETKIRSCKMGRQHLGMGFERQPRNKNGCGLPAGCNTAIHPLLRRINSCRPSGTSLNQKLSTTIRNSGLRCMMCAPLRPRHKRIDSIGNKRSAAVKLPLQQGHSGRGEAADV
jgi:hypothetical protein